MLGSAVCQTGLQPSIIHAEELFPYSAGGRPPTARNVCIVCSSCCTLLSKLWMFGHDAQMQMRCPPFGYARKTWGWQKTYRVLLTAAWAADP
jgi:hypothetical protein